MWKYTTPDGLVHYTNVRPSSGSAEVLFNYVEISGHLWQAVFTAADGTEVLVNMKKVTRAGDEVTAWVMFSFPSPKKVDSVVAESQIEKWNISCSTQRATKTDVIAYGGPLASGVVEYSWAGTVNDWPSVPGTSSEAVMQAVCRTSANR